MRNIFNVVGSTIESFAIEFDISVRGPGDWDLDFMHL